MLSAVPVVGPFLELELRHKVVGMPVVAAGIPVVAEDSFEPDNFQLDTIMVVIEPPVVELDKIAVAQAAAARTEVQELFPVHYLNSLLKVVDLLVFVQHPVAMLFPQVLPIGIVQSSNLRKTRFGTGRRKQLSNLLELVVPNLY